MRTCITDMGCNSDDAGTRLCGGGQPHDLEILPRVLPRYHVLSTCSFVQLGCIDAEAD
jgi:hypothetical protein